MAERKTTTKPRVPRPVSTAERNYYRANDKLNKFKEDNAEFMDQLYELVQERERARERLLAVVSTHRVGAGGMRVSTSRPRKFHGEFLYQYLPSEVRDQVVSLEYKVNVKGFDKAVKDGLIEEEMATEAYERGDERVSISKQIKPINLG
mgnify:CR=1 FL=1